MLFVIQVRPPGHHATIKQAMGFCLHNNAAIAAIAAQKAGAQKVLIVDWVICVMSTYILLLKFSAFLEMVASVCMGEVLCLLVVTGLHGFVTLNLPCILCRTSIMAMAHRKYLMETNQ
jgi:Histone deacetylase domain